MGLVRIGDCVYREEDIQWVRPKKTGEKTVGIFVGFRGGGQIAVEGDDAKAFALAVRAARSIGVGFSDGSGKAQGRKSGG